VAEFTDFYAHFRKSFCKTGSRDYELIEIA